MQEENPDYYAEGLDDEEGAGCCLLCPNSEPGCWCYKCKCKTCLYYEGNNPENYKCEMKQTNGGG